MRETRPYGSEGGEAKAFPTPISKIKGKTPIKALACTKNKLVFPNKTKIPTHPLKKPKEGRYHFVRFIRSDLKLNIFGEVFTVPPQAQYEYVVATIDVKEQKLKLLLGKTQLEEFNYPLR